MSLSTPPQPEPVGGSTAVVQSIPYLTLRRATDAHLRVSNAQPPLIGQCPYCGRVNFVPPAPFNTYELRGVQHIARVGQHLRGYLPGSTSRTCARCARTALKEWKAQAQHASH